MHSPDPQDDACNISSAMLLVTHTRCQDSGLGLVEVPNSNTVLLSTSLLLSTGAPPGGTEQSVTVGTPALAVYGEPEWEGLSHTQSKQKESVAHTKLRCTRLVLFAPKCPPQF
jgi:hypothetical protein